MPKGSLRKTWDTLAEAIVPIPASSLVPTVKSDAADAGSLYPLAAKSRPDCAILDRENIGRCSNCKIVRILRTRSRFSCHDWNQSSWRTIAPYQRGVRRSMGCSTRSQHRLANKRHPARRLHRPGQLRSKRTLWPDSRALLIDPRERHPLSWNVCRAST